MWHVALRSGWCCRSPRMRTRPGWSVCVVASSRSLDVSAPVPSQASLARVTSKLFHLSDGRSRSLAVGSFQIDCSGDGTINYYTDAQCTSSMGTSVTLASLLPCDELQTTYTCDAGTPRFTYFANSGCTGDSITGLEFLGTACYTEVGAPRPHYYIRVCVTQAVRAN